MKVTCGACIFFEADESECRLFPPKVFLADGSYYTAYPTVKDTEWCGEFIARNDAPSEQEG